MATAVRSLFASLLLAALAPPQTDTASLTGSCPYNLRLIQKAVVKVTNRATNISVTLTTNDKGYYFVPDLRPGVYNLSAAHPGFKLSEHSCSPRASTQASSCVFITNRSAIVTPM
jgi:hypothetical protein